MQRAAGSRVTVTIAGDPLAMKWTHSSSLMPTIKKQTTTQRQRFIEKARELGCDEDEAAFEERLRKITKAPPPAPDKKKPRKV